MVFDEVVVQHIKRSLKKLDQEDLLTLSAQIDSMVEKKEKNRKYMESYIEASLKVGE
ncbi:hypothetical protein [Priestia filamentosa]|uniref:hypothetical protein n=1 Tax=Priestia filamentosa TaxID=1402861 RepID=UPI000A9ABD17|nr:hypothetical protein [Priestia filamentosa]